jgi:4-amino-4-deoxy-L-arabinose transferase-like glycosyltransferase
MEKNIPGAELPSVLGLRIERELAFRVLGLAGVLLAFYITYAGVHLLEGRQHISRGVAYFVVATIILVVMTWRVRESDESASLTLPALNSSTLRQPKQLARDLRASWQAVAWWGLLIAAIGLAVGFRLYEIASQPFGIWFDEAQNGIVAREILHGARPIFIGGYSQLPALFFYLFALAIKLLGDNITSLRAVPTASGILAVLLIYPLARELFDQRVAVLSTFFLAVMRWHVTFSRFAMHGIFAPLLMVTTFYFLVRGLKGKGLWNFVVAGIMVGIGLQGYYSFLLVPFLIGFYVLHHMIFERVLHWRRLALGLGAIVIATAIVYAPLGIWALQHPDQFNQRPQTVSITQNRSTSQALHVAYTSMKQHLLMFNAAGDNNGRHNIPGAPMLDIYTGSLLILGAGYALSRAKKSSYFLLLAWVVILLQPGVWSDGPPQAYRTLAVTPAIAMLAALPLALLWRLATKQTDAQASEARRWPSRLGYYGLAGAAAFVTVFALVQAGRINFDKYFNVQLQRPDVWAEYSAAPTIVGHEINRLRPDHYEFFISTTYINEPSRIFLNGPQTDDIVAFEMGRDIPVSDPRPTVFFLDNLEEAKFLRLRSLYPDGVFTVHRAPAGGGPVLFEAILGTADIRSLMGVHAVYTGSNGQRVERLETQIDFDWATQAPLLPPLRAAWSGFITLPEYGEYVLGLRIPGHGRIVLDGEPFAEGDGTAEGRALLFQGAHQIEVEADVRETGLVQLYWQQPRGKAAGTAPAPAPVPVPAPHLFSSAKVSWGLRASFYSGLAFEGPPVLERLEPFVAARYEIPGGPFSVRWKGKLLVPASGPYGLRLETIGDGKLLIDGKPILTSAIDHHGEEAAVPLTAGAHDIEVLFSNGVGSAQIFLSWRPPNGEWASIPSQNFALR